MLALASKRKKKKNTGMERVNIVNVLNYSTHTSRK